MSRVSAKGLALGGKSWQGQPCQKYTRRGRALRVQGYALGRLDELNEARGNVLGRVKVAEKDREALEGAKAAAEAYLGKERECTRLHTVIYQLFVSDAQVRLAQLRAFLSCRWSWLQL